MLFSLINLVLNHFLFFILHIEESRSFKKPLSLQKEKEYFAKKEQGDQNARNLLIEHNLRLVAHIVKKYYASTNDQDDLISIGTIGLIKAVNTFTYDRGTKFATYAARCIENEILMYFRNIKKSASDIYINEPIEGDSENGAITLLDVFSDEDTLIENIDLKLKSNKLYDFIESSLDDREKEVIILRYGLRAKRPLTQREIAKKLDISRSYVSRIEKKAIEKLKKRFDLEQIKY